MAKAKKEKQKMNYHVTILNEISEEGATAVKNFVVSNILNDTFIFNTKQEDGTIKRMTLNELVEKYDTYPNAELAEKESSSLPAKAED